MWPFVVVCEEKKGKGGKLVRSVMSDSWHLVSTTTGPASGKEPGRAGKTLRSGREGKRKERGGSMESNIDWGKTLYPGKMLIPPFVDEYERRGNLYLPVVKKVRCGEGGGTSKKD